MKTNNVTYGNNLILLIFLIIIFLIIFFAIKKYYLLFRYKHWFGTFKLKSPEISTEIPFDGDLQLCSGYIEAIDPHNVYFKNKLAAFFVRMINNGDIMLLKKDRKAKIINPPAAELPSSVITSYENVYHCLLSILWANSDNDHIVHLNDIKINPFDKEKDSLNYNKFEEYYNIISKTPNIKLSKITPQEARSVMGLKRYLQEAAIDYKQNTMTISGIPSTEYLVYECLFGITNHSDLKFYYTAIGFSNLWSNRLPRKERIKILKRKIKIITKKIIAIITVILAILEFIAMILSIFSSKDSNNDRKGEFSGFGGGSFGGGGASGSW